MKDEYFFQFDERKHVGISPINKFLLLFKKRQIEIDEISGHGIVFKELRGTVFILKEFISISD